VFFPENVRLDSKRFCNICQ